jgi:hypothetical protein
LEPGVADGIVLDAVDWQCLAEMYLREVEDANV